jgi:glycosyltransferase involved in cell wall biosynthesis
MRLSIAMCTFNGTKYLNEQLDSIASQIRPPDELVICDDCSGDGTYRLVEAFADRVSFSVRIYKNDKNLGSTKNFEKAISLCSGDIIALSDQDDVWNLDKLMKIENIFINSPEVGAVFTDAKVVDEDLRPLGYRLWQSVWLDKARQKQILSGQAYKVLLKNNVVTGATMAFRSGLKDMILPIPPTWIHDGWIALIISAVSSLTIIPEPLIKYRKHHEQQIGIKKGFSKNIVDSRKKSFEDYRKTAEQYECAYDSLNKRAHIDNMQLRLMKAKIDHLLFKSRLPKNKVSRLPQILKELFSLGYYHYSGNALLFAAHDIFLL